MINGSDEPVMVLAPLILMFAPEPGSPVDLVIETPDALPAIPCNRPVSPERTTSGAPIFELAVPNLSALS